MSVTYDIGTLAAELQLSAISTRHGGVIHSGLIWTLTSSRKKTHRSTDAQPLFQVPGGEYTLEVTHKSKPYSFGRVHLERNTRLDLVVLLQASTPNEYDPNEEYFVDPKDITAISENERRKLERQGQRKYCVASGPLHEFDAAMQHSGELSSTMKSLKAHPLLSQTAQFDGVAPDLRIDNPESNEEGLAKTIQLTLQKQLENQPGPNPGPRPY